MSVLATRLKHFGVFLADGDPDLDSITALQRRRHIEPFQASQVDAASPENGEPITVADRSRRVLALACFLTDQPATGRHHRRRRLEGHPAGEDPDGRRVLPARARPRRLRLRHR
ncbi:MAG: hypothetical protein WCF04_03220 [Candidatus Nanopelagicales bacterium]